MKLNKTIYALSMAGMMGFWSCTSDETMPEAGVASGERVPITIEVSRGGDALTRTDLSEDLQEGGLTHTWASGDELYLYDSNGAEAGKVTLQSGEGTASGVFTGEVTATSGNYCLWYFGSKQSTAENAEFAASYPYIKIANGQVTIDLKTPTFANAEEFSKVDVLSQTATINVQGKNASVAESVTMQPHVALARFDLQNLPANVTGTLKVYDTKAGTPEYINTKQTLSLAKGETVKSEETEAYTFVNWSSNNDLYLAFVPYSSNLKFEYTYNKEVQEVVNGSKVNKTYPIKNIHLFKEDQALVAGTYYQTFTPAEGAETSKVGGVEVPFEIDDSDNPGNMNNWGGAGSSYQRPFGVKIGPYFHSKSGGWVNNIKSVYDMGGWCYAMTFTNGIDNGILVSTAYKESDVTKSVYDEGIYFQWGRPLGFPELNSNLTSVDGYWYDSSSELIDWTKLPELVGYLDYTGMDIFYEALFMGDSKEDNVTRAKDWGRVYGLTQKDWGYDYIYNNQFNSNWYARGVDPSPSQWKMPIWDELAVFIPQNTKTINGSYAEVKTIKGVNYAMKWSVGSVKEGGNTINYIDIFSVKTSENNVSKDSPIFKDITPIRIKAYGFLSNVASQLRLGTAAVYWSSDSDDQNMFTTGVKVKGGKTLFISFDSNNNAVFEENKCLPFGCALPIIPIKDLQRVSEPIEPIFAWSYEISMLKKR